MLIVVLLLALLAGLGGWYFGVARYTSTPSVLSLTQSAATSKLDRAGLDLKVEDQAYSETVKKGLVVSTNPDPGDRVLKNGTVGAVISLGPERHKVPDVRNQTLDDAQQAIDESKLAYGGDTERYDEKIAKGHVITTDPAPGTSLRPNAAVGVVVSKGPRPIKIPDLTGRLATFAKEALQKRGFKVDTTEVNDDTVPEGRIVSQSPDSGTGQKDDVISLVVSKGPVMVEVPNVVGMGLDAATQRLESAGFQVSVRHSSMYIGVQYVVSTDPGRGSSARKGSTVTVNIV
jgi:beta-lactam-binding protein with PASTA domain